MNRDILSLRRKAVEKAFSEIQKLIEPDVLHKLQLHLPSRERRIRDIAEFCGIVENRAPVVFRIWKWSFYSVNTIFFSQPLVRFNKEYFTDPSCPSLTWELLEYRVKMNPRVLEALKKVNDQ